MEYCYGEYEYSKRSMPTDQSWVAPEILNLQPWEELQKANIYSIGMLIYWLVYRKFPTGQPINEVINRENQKYWQWEVDHKEMMIDGPFNGKVNVETLVKQMISYDQSQRIDLDRIWAESKKILNNHSSGFRLMLEDRIRSLQWSEIMKIMPELEDQNIQSE